MKKLGLGIIACIMILWIGISWANPGKSSASKLDDGVRKVNLVAPKGKAIAAFAEGCFWTSQHIFDAIIGVDSAVSGYAGGTKVLPTYEEVSAGGTGHAETVLVYYDPKIISYSDLIKAFFASHDATTENRQGPDVGDDYRSIIFYSTPYEKSLAESSKTLINKSHVFPAPVVTQILPLNAFYRAEEYHQLYAIHHPENPYIASVSNARFDRFVKNFKTRIKASAR
jgi:peptide-methionine (S)-S-oxide reductase